MNKEDVDFISTAETYRSLSTTCIWLTIFSLVAHEITVISNFISWQPTSTIVIILALLAIAFRAVAIDRFLRMAHQQNYNEKHPDI